MQSNKRVKYKYFTSNSKYEPTFRIDRENLLLCCFCATRKNNTTTYTFSHFPIADISQVQSAAES